MEATETQTEDETFPENAASASANNKLETNAMRPICMDDVIDDNLPKSYKNMISFFSADELNSTRLLAIVLYIIAVESGYTAYINDSTPLNECCYTFLSKNIDNISNEIIISKLKKEEFIFPLYLGSIIKCTLSIKPYFEKLVINLFSPGSLICFSKILDVSSYVTNNRLNNHEVKKLSVSCKNDLFYPLKSHYLYMHEIKHPCLIDLPFEIFMHIAQYLQAKDFLNLCSTCCYLNYNFSDNENIWKFYEKKYDIKYKVKKNKRQPISFKSYQNFIMPRFFW